MIIKMDRIVFGRVTGTCVHIENHDHIDVSPQGTQWSPRSDSKAHDPVDPPCPVGRRATVPP